MSYLLASSFFSVLKKLDREKALKTGKTIGNLFWNLGYRKDVILKNLDIAFPEKDKNWKLQTGKASLQNIGKVLAEFPKIPEYKKSGQLSQIYQIVEGKEYLQEKGAKILTSAHIGNWELGGACMALEINNLISLAYRMRNEKLNNLITSIRQEAGIKIIFHDQPLKDFIKAIREGKTISFLIDQNALRHRGVFVDFFGLPASTVTFPAKLAVKFKLPIYFAYGVYDRNSNRLNIFIKKIDFSPTGNEEEDIRNLTALYTKEVEKAARQYPDQYFWVHKRWKTRPEGEPENIY